MRPLYHLAAFGTNLEFIFLQNPKALCKEIKSIELNILFLSGGNFRDGFGSEDECASS